MPKFYRVIGLMSGTSLDGLDLACCTFLYENGKWTFSIEAAETIPYPKEIENQLRTSFSLKSEELCILDHRLGIYFGECVNHFIHQKNISNIDYISSHGHTVFHRPDLGYTYQIGNGHDLQTTTQLPVVYDFRSQDVALGGQGAPLVPIGDQLLFSEFDACINLGGIANISYQSGKDRIAYDTCPFNMALNLLASRKGNSYDKNGTLARSGSINPQLFETMNALPFYSKAPPKSLGKEWFDSNFVPLLMNDSIENLSNTCVHHFATILSKAIAPFQRILITGGGSYHSYFIEVLKKYSSSIIFLPSNLLIEYKEALIFAFLGVLRVENQFNCLNSVTGARKNHSSGIILNNFM